VSAAAFVVSVVNPLSDTLQATTDADVEIHFVIRPESVMILYLDQLVNQLRMIPSVDRDTEIRLEIFA